MTVERSPVELPPSPRPLPSRRADTEHGTEAGYLKGCRCMSCAKAARSAAKNRKARTRKLKGPLDARHGTDLGYRSYGCRCERCTAAGTIARRMERQRLKEKKEK